MTLLQRIGQEKRPVIWTLALAVAANLGVYAFVVYPLATRSAGAQDRAAAAARELQNARRDAASANALVTGKARADQELAAFYDRVLPADLATARRLTYARLPALARDAGVRYESGHTDIDTRTGDSRFGRLKTALVLQGDYEGIRRFIYSLETAPEFLIIDTVTIAQPEPEKPLSLSLELSTYYRLPNDH